MARASLPPGFRFHPTDVELILYYLKRKVMGKKLHLEAIAEVNIYKFSPWDLPDKSCLRSKDLEWYFFCPREKKYASGVRVKRATENGFWKATGKDRLICHNNKTIGKTKTLVFHLGHAPKGERTDWVLHEYTILDNQLAASGVQDTYMLCKIFKKNGLGPRNGAHYGAPFNEAEWSEDDVDDAQNHVVSLSSDGPLPITQMQTEEQCCPPVTRLFGPEKNKSGSSLIEDQLTSSSHPTSEVAADKTDDEIVRLLAQFTDDDMMLFPESSVNQDDLSGKGKKSIPCSNGYDVYSGLGDLDSWSRMNEDRLDFWRMQNHQNSLENQLLIDSSSYIELDDLMTPLNFPENVQSSNGETFRLHENGQQSVSGANSAVMNKYAAYANQLHVPPVGTYGGNNFLNLPQTVNSLLYQGGSFASNELDFSLGQQNSGVSFAQDIERGAHSKICLARFIPARSPSAAGHIALSFCSCGGSSIHIKAEVTHGAGECTNEALSVMMGGSSSCWCTTLPWAVFQGMMLLCFRLVSLVGFSFGVLVFCCCFSESRCVLLSFTILIQIKVQSLCLLECPFGFWLCGWSFLLKLPTYLFRCFPVKKSRKSICLVIERSFW